MAWRQSHSKSMVLLALDGVVANSLWSGHPAKQQMNDFDSHSPQIRKPDVHSRPVPRCEQHTVRGNASSSGRRRVELVQFGITDATVMKSGCQQSKLASIPGEIVKFRQVADSATANDFNSIILTTDRPT